MCMLSVHFLCFFFAHVYVRHIFKLKKMERKVFYLTFAQEVSFPVIMSCFEAVLRVKNALYRPKYVLLPMCFLFDLEK